MFTSLAHFVYRITPFRSVRQLYFRAYARAVRNRQVVADVDGVRLHLDLAELIDLATYLGKFEPNMVRAVERYCRPGMTVLDIGANVGVHAFRFGRIVGERGHVYAFEPTTFAFSRLQRNLALNPGAPVSIYRIALSDENQPGRVISARSSWRTDGVSQDTSCEVEFVRLDDWISSTGVAHVDLVKLDVDGNEFGVLAGGIEMLRRCHPMLLMEAGDYHFQDQATNPFRLLAELGYRFWDLSLTSEYRELNDILRAVRPAHGPRIDSINLLAIATSPGAVP